MFKPMVLALVLLLSPAAPAAAQSGDAATASPEELIFLFQKQKSRGLKIAPGTGVAASTAVEPVATTDVVTAGTAEAAPVATAETVTGTQVVATPGAAVTPVGYTEFDRAEQVNLRINFDFDSAVLRESEKPKLASLCSAMKAVDVALFRIVGHTDATGTDAYNETLSLLRAEEVKRHLVEDCGIAPERLEAVGVGRRFLFNTEDPTAEENRRVEFQALS
jgi:outer membrane protein OmpA-like peptidoglycan-associated protein